MKVKTLQAFVLMNFPQLQILRCELRKLYFFFLDGMMTMFALDATSWIAKLELLP